MTRANLRTIAIVSTAVAFVAFIVATIVLADMHRLGFLYAVYDFPYGDKAGHFVLFGTMALLICLAALQLRGNVEGHRVVSAVALVIAIAVSLEEASQAWMPARTLDAIDLLASYAGIAMGAIVALAAGRALRREVCHRCSQMGSPGRSRRHSHP